MKPINGWWFGGDVLPHNDGRRVRRNSVLTVQGDLELCRNGLHMSRRVLDALEYATTNQLWRVQSVGDVVEGDDKLCTSKRLHIAKIDAEPVLRKFARMCALDVIHLWDAPDVVTRFLKTGDESLRDAAWEKQSRRLERMCLRAIKRELSKHATGQQEAK